ncbi:hypothetical protein T439DRAFT_322952 [Meredithblackwellia eburnea MCA 4105]
MYDSNHSNSSRHPLHPQGQPSPPSHVPATAHPQPQPGHRPPQTSQPGPSSQHHTANGSSSSSSSDIVPIPVQPNPPQLNAAAAAALALKSRSAIACVLCRRQKMKCSGGSPCRRCKTAGVDCVFESPPVSAPRPRTTNSGVSEAWVESRLSTVEDRISQLEDASDSSPSTALTTRNRAPSAATSPQLQVQHDHERRIAQLEAQIYALQLAASPTPPNHLARSLPPSAPPSQQHIRSFSTPSQAGAPQSSQVTPNPYGFPSHLQSQPQDHYQPPAGFPNQQALFSLPPAPSQSPISFMNSPGSSGMSHHASPYPAQPPPVNHNVAPYPSYPPAGRHTFPHMNHQQPQGASSSNSSSSSASAQAAGPFPGSPLSSNSNSNGGADATGPNPRERDPPPLLPDCSRTEKRWKGEDGSDFITRGEVQEDEAMLCFESYFLNYNFLTDPAASNLSRPIHLSFEETRRVSPILLATVVFIGARSLSHFETSSLALAEALRLSHYTFLGERPPREVEFKALTLLALYTGMDDLTSHVITMAYDLGMTEALLKYDKLSDEDKEGPIGEHLVLKGRAFFISHLWSAFYTFNRGKPGGYHIPKEVLRRQIDIMEASVHTQQPTDRIIKVEVEALIIIRATFDRLGPACRIEDPTFEELSVIVGDAIVELQDWSRKWLDMMELVSTWGDSQELKASVPFHHMRMCILMWVFKAITPSTAHLFPRIREFSTMARDSALTILRFGVESRIWLPYSMVGQYLLHCNIPTCLFLLSSTSKLFPQDTPFSLVRQLLHRLLKQCDDTIRQQMGTCREITRARVTKETVLEFDRYAFEVSGTESDPKPPDDSLFGEDISGSLSALGGELNLWGAILLGCLDYEGA